MDIPLQFHEFQHLNHIERCPKYTEILQKLDVIQINDLDALHTDLENLQGASNIRLRRLEDEIKILTEWCDKKDRNSKSEVDLELLATTTTVTAAATTTTKRSRTGGTEESKISKKQKIEETPKSGSSKLRSKGKATIESVEAESSVATTSKPRLTYDAPNKFWGYVEPYCSDITIEDIKVLEDSLNSKVDINEYYKTPPLGRHYSEIWAKEDFIEEQQNSSKIDKKRSTPLTNVENIENKFLKVDTEGEREQCPYGNFTQRLIAALVDENIMAPMTENELQDVVRIADNQGNVKKTDSNKKMPVITNTKSLENAIKDELFALGLIDSTADEEQDYDAEDEILGELRKCQSELKALRSHNKQSINRLLSKAKTAMTTQEVRQKAKVLDGEVVDIFRRFASSKTKKKAFSRKDRETAWKAIRERETLWKLVENNDSEKPMTESQ